MQWEGPSPGGSPTDLGSQASCPACPTGRRQAEGELSSAQAARALQEEASPRLEHLAGAEGRRLQVGAPHTPGQGAGWGGGLLGEGGFQVPVGSGTGCAGLGQAAPGHRAPTELVRATLAEPSLQWSQPLFYRFADTES